MNKKDLEDRLIRLAVSIIKISKDLDKSSAGKILASQIVRSGTSPALNYAEAQDAESKRDFLHKLKIALKELRETMVCLKIIQQSDLIGPSEQMEKTISECNELISIFVATIKTTRSNTK